jgi:hypothetical protein
MKDNQIVNEIKFNNEPYENDDKIKDLEDDIAQNSYDSLIKPFKNVVQEISPELLNLYKNLAQKGKYDPAKLLKPEEKSAKVMAVPKKLTDKQQQAIHFACLLPFEFPQHRDRVIDLIKEPFKLNQGLYYVCGVTVVMKLLIEKYPIAFAKMISDLLRTGKCQEPFEIKLRIPRDYRPLAMRDIDEIILTSMRNTKNKILSLKTFFFDKFAGVTKPQEVEEWLNTLKESGGESSRSKLAVNLMRLCDMNQQTIHTFKKAILGIKQNTPEEFKDLGANLDKCVEFSNNPKGIVIMLLSVELVAKLFGQTRGEESILGVELTHYVNVNQVAIKDGHVKISVETWGQAIDATLSKKEFLKGYRGCILTELPEDLSYEQELLSSNNPLNPLLRI